MAQWKSMQQFVPVIRVDFWQINPDQRINSSYLLTENILRADTRVSSIPVGIYLLFSDWILQAASIQSSLHYYKTIQTV